MGACSLHLDYSKPMRDLPHNTETTISRVQQLTMEALRDNARLRKALQIGGPIVSTSTAGLLQVASKFASGGWMVGWNVASAGFAVVAVFIAIVLALTEKNLPEALQEAHALDERVKQLEAAKQCDQMRSDEIGAQFSSLTTLYATSIALREIVEPVLSLGSGDERAQKNRLGAMLDILLSSKRELFGITDERWNFSIYLWNDASQELICFACRRRDRADEEASHRAWPAGSGQIGVCFQSRREVVVGDVQMPEFKAYFQVPDPLSRSDDAERYRSIAAVPISMNGGVPHGVVIATSDVPGRFVPSGVSDGWDTVEPLRVLAGVLVILLSATELHLRLGDQK
jgi:hypothetical protein